MLLRALALSLVVASAARAGPVVSSITVGGGGRILEIDVAASGPLGYLLNETPDPFTLSLLFADASLGFPDERRTFAGLALSEIQARTLTRDGNTLARLDLTFDREVPYTVAREGSRLRVRVETAGPKSPVVIGAAEGSSPTGRAELRAVRPESLGGAARLALDIDGAPVFKAFAMTRPARVVVDLKHAWVATKRSSIPVNGNLLRSVRTSQHTRTVVRIVCDLNRAAAFRVETVPGGLIVHLGAGVR